MVDHQNVPVRTIYERAVMMDTSAFVAILGEQQSESIHCRQSIQSKNLPVYVTSDVIVESHRRLLFDHGRQLGNQFLEEVYRSDIEVIRPREKDEQEAIQLIQKYADLDLTFCDAITFSVMLRLGIVRAFTHDRNHFWAVGFITVPPLDI